jgi:hypothetical protein
VSVSAAKVGQTVRSKIDLGGLRMGSPQVLGAIRIVPLIRDVVQDDIRIAKRVHRSIDIVAVDGAKPDETGIKYVAFVPHAYVISFTEDGEPVASMGASFGAPTAEKKDRFVRLTHRMVKREADIDGTKRVRLLPHHLAMEGFLALHFRGPELIWKEYSKHAARFGLDPRVERVTRGAWLAGLGDALRTFELVPNQVGVLFFVAEALAAAFVLPHPEDYARLHRSVLDDYFGQLLIEYAILNLGTPSAWTELDTKDARTLEDLARAVETTRAAWREYTDLLTAGLFEREVDLELVRTMGRFRLERFLPLFDPDAECHIGERIVRDDGTLQYLKTFRLSHAQVRRAWLLMKLSEAKWSLSIAAFQLKCPQEELVQRIKNAGLGYMLRPDVLARAGAC